MEKACYRKKNAYLKHNPDEQLHDVTDLDVELASAETGAMLALIHYLMAEPLDRKSTRIRSRIEHMPTRVEGEHGLIVLEYAPGRKVKSMYDAKHLDCRFEHIKLQDERLQRNWGPHVYRIILEEQVPVHSGLRTLRIATGN